MSYWFYKKYFEVALLLDEHFASCYKVYMDVILALYGRLTAETKLFVNRARHTKVTLPNTHYALRSTRSPRSDWVCMCNKKRKGSVDKPLHNAYVQYSVRENSCTPVHEKRQCR